MFRRSIYLREYGFDTDEIQIVRILEIRDKIYWKI